MPLQRGHVTANIPAVGLAARGDATADTTIPRMPKKKPSQKNPAERASQRNREPTLTAS
jgi:hypothetical protein